ncbi:MAG: hypothetical protein JSU63_09235, partial [Phycisphaerales bacterium]
VGDGHHRISKGPRPVSQRAEGLLSLFSIRDPAGSLLSLFAICYSVFLIERDAPSSASFAIRHSPF